MKTEKLMITIWALGLALATGLLQAQSVCARVQIEIRQELTLERQAFDATMRINNGLATSALENVIVEVLFRDRHGNPVVATSDREREEKMLRKNNWKLPCE